MLATALVFHFRDAKGKESTTKFHVRSTVSVTDLVDYVQAAAEVIQGLTTAEITGVTVSLGLDLSGASLKAVATTFSDWFNKGLFTLYESTLGLFSKIFLPTWDEAHNHANSDQIDLADANVATLVTILEDGVTLSALTTRVVNFDGEFIDEVRSGREIFRES